MKNTFVLIFYFAISLINAQTPSDSISANPNPFHKRTLVSYTLATNDTITIRVYNLSGQLIVPLVTDSIVPAGIHQDSLIMDNFPDGVYLLSFVNRHKNLKVAKIVKTFGASIHQQNANNFDIIVYPNPVKYKLSLQYDENQMELDRLTITNLLGQTVLILNRPKQEIDISVLPTGLYHLKVECNEGQKVFEIMKE